MPLNHHLNTWAENVRNDAVVDDGQTAAAVRDREMHYLCLIVACDIGRDDAGDADGLRAACGAGAELVDGHVVFRRRTGVGDDEIRHGGGDRQAGDDEAQRQLAPASWTRRLRSLDLSVVPNLRLKLRPHAPTSVYLSPGRDRNSRFAG